MANCEFTATLCFIFVALVSSNEVIMNYNHQHHEHNSTAEPTEVSPETHEITENNGKNNATDGCNGNPCLSYTVLKTLPDEIEERQYAEDLVLPAYKSVACSQFHAARSQGYFHLSMYARSALNEEGRRLPMGVPVLVEAAYVNDVLEGCSWIFTTLFHVGNTTAPKPKNPSIHLHKLEDSKFYVGHFSGFIRNFKDHVLELREKLNVQKLCYNPQKFYIASYQSPGVLFGRRNEILFPARDFC